MNKFKKIIWNFKWNLKYKIFKYKLKRNKIKLSNYGDEKTLSWKPPKSNSISKSHFRGFTNH